MHSGASFAPLGYAMCIGDGGKLLILLGSLLQVVAKSYPHAMVGLAARRAARKCAGTRREGAAPRAFCAFGVFGNNSYLLV
jgi:hypothetical protein